MAELGVLVIVDKGLELGGDHSSPEIRMQPAKDREHCKATDPRELAEAQMRAAASVCTSWKSCPYHRQRMTLSLSHTSSCFKITRERIWQTEFHNSPGSDVKPELPNS